MTRKIVCVLLAAMLTVLALPAQAADSSLLNVIDFKFRHYENGIGYGNCPVYTAPSKSAYRGADGKASVDTNHDMWVGGFETGSGWLLVRYDTSYGIARVGYIPPEFIRGFKTDFDKLKFSYIEQKATDYINITDNPLNSNTSFGTLSPGQTYYILGKYTYYGNWWYIECYINGQVARGFIDRNTTPVDNGSGKYSTDIGEPEFGPQGQRKIGRVRIQGEAKIVRQNAGPKAEMVARVNYPEEYPCYDRKTGDNGNVWYLIWVDGVWGWISSGVCIFVSGSNTNTSGRNTGYTPDNSEPEFGPQYQTKIGRVRIHGENKFVRQNANPKSDLVAVVSYPEDFPCYDRKTGTNGNIWYLIWADGVWGWISAGVSTFYQQ